MTQIKSWKPYSGDSELVDLYRQDGELLVQRTKLIAEVRQPDELIPEDEIYGAFRSIDRQRSWVWDQIRRRKCYLSTLGSLVE